MNQYSNAKDQNYQLSEQIYESMDKQIRIFKVKIILNQDQKKIFNPVLSSESLHEKTLRRFFQRNEHFKELKQPLHTESL